MWYVYLLECKDGSLYTGITNDLKKRLVAHKAGTASKYTASRGAKRMVYQEHLRSRSAALKREAAIKGFTRAKKIALFT